MAAIDDDVTEPGAAHRVGRQPGFHPNVDLQIADSGGARNGRSSERKRRRGRLAVPTIIW